MRNSLLHHLGEESLPPYSTYWENKKSAIAQGILNEMFPPNEDEEDEDESEDDDIDDEDIAAALKAGDLNKAFRLATALDEQRDFAAFRAEAISH